MNYDLIIKLAKLANNNPNDNEANMAARKVCKLLAEANFNFTQHNGDDSRRRPVSPPNQSNQRSPWDDLNDMVNEMHRQQREAERRAREEASRNTANEEARRRNEEDRRRHAEQQRNTYRDPNFDPYKRSYWADYGFDPFDFSESTERQRAEDARRREEELMREAREKARADRERAQRDRDFKKKGWI